jgi:hypothetical protein
MVEWLIGLVGWGEERTPTKSGENVGVRPSPQPTRDQPFNQSTIQPFNHLTIQPFNHPPTI